jgi:AhpD family alkylhydroperoxidase
MPSPELHGRCDVYRAWDGLYTAIIDMTRAVHKSGLDRRIIELVNVRASQINGCTHCLDRHTTAGVEHAGWDPRHLASVGAWRDAPWFDTRERAALALTEAVIGSGPIDEGVVREAEAVYGIDGLAKVLLAIVAINCFNRVNVAAGIAPLP